ncbi:unnamed protein product [Nesidiocoris tenuis]|uniref:Uncharacterized protein n=1 Tax=Nesidiocoris tenuis TaxID=355587 RepID=A0A6H5GCS6_9HEMI|nr:unnamed protein product [Nesidiocoris tenuis]
MLAKGMESFQKTLYFPLNHSHSDFKLWNSRTCLICKITLVFVEKPLRGKKQPHLCLLHQQGDALTLRPVALGNIGGGSGRCRGKAGEERHQSRSRDSRQSSCSSTSRLIRRCRPILVVDCLRIPRISLNPSNKFEGSGPKATKTQPQLHLQVRMDPDSSN